MDRVQRRKSFPHFALLAAVLALAACEDTGTNPPVAAALEAENATERAGVAGQTLSEPLTVRAVDETGAGVPVTVSFEATSGALSENSVLTGTDGLASVEWTLGSEPGEQQVTASVPGADPVVFTAVVTAPGAFQFAGVAAGSFHTCGTTVTGDSFCWGRDADGQLGDGDEIPEDCIAAPGNDCSTVPVPVAGGVTWASITTGEDFTCGVGTDDAGYCWGENTSGEIGTGTDTPVSTPTPIAGGHTWEVTSAGFGNHGCGLTTDGDAYCWGDNFYGQIGNGRSSGEELEPVEVRGGHTWTMISAGDDHSCALTTDGMAYCWGSNVDGQIGNRNTDALGPNTPVIVGGGHTFAAIAAGGDHTCGLTEEQEVYCWGSNNSGQVGDGTTIDRAEPVPVSGTQTFVSVTAGEAHSCARTDADEVYCWGSNFGGQLGTGAGGDAPTPQPVAGGLSFAAVSAGSIHTCAITTEGTPYCWGRNSNGQLGDGSTIDRPTPTPVVEP